MTKPSAWKKTGIVFLLCAATGIAAPAQTFNSLLSFDGSDGEIPTSLIQGPDGHFFGTTTGGGMSSSTGTAFRVSPNGALNSYLFCSQEGCVDGYRPSGGLTIGIDGRYYGTTQFGGPFNKGTVFKITQEGKLTTLYSFCPGNNDPCPDGQEPASGVVQGPDGNLYGTTVIGGFSFGTVFKLTPNGLLTTLFNFNVHDGEWPGGLIQGTDGNFYGTTITGGASTCPGCGTVFKITPKGALTVLHYFNGNDGSGPVSLIEATDGNFYGVTEQGGTSNACNSNGLGCGTIFRVAPTGAFVTLYSFCVQLACADGYLPLGSLVQAPDGNFYGTTYAGGDATCDLVVETGCGTVFEITPSGNLTTLHVFEAVEGALPEGGFIIGTDGVFYGTTGLGGLLNCNAPVGCGTFFSMATGLGPFVAFVRAYGKVGQTGDILGQGFTGTTSVSLNGIPASFTVVSDTFIKATVPVGATTGYVTVTTPSGTLTSNVPFRVIQ